MHCWAGAGGRLTLFKHQTQDSPRLHGCVASNSSGGTAATYPSTISTRSSVRSWRTQGTSTLRTFVCGCAHRSDTTALIWWTQQRRASSLRTLRRRGSSISASGLGTSTCVGPRGATQSLRRGRRGFVALRHCRSLRTQSQARRLGRGDTQTLLHLGHGSLGGPRVHSIVPDAAGDRGHGSRPTPETHARRVGHARKRGATARLQL